MQTLHVAAWAAVVSMAPAQERAPRFKIENQLPRLPADDQGRTGTCWSFSTTSFLESELHRLHGRPIDLSELHTVYWGYVEKARRYVLLHGKTQFGQGGLSHDVTWIANRHGVVPRSSYTGLVGDATEHDHGELEAALAAMLEPIAESRSPSPNWSAAVRGVLDAYLGPPPASVDTPNGNLTPRQYAESLRLPEQSYRQLMSSKAEPYWRHTELLVPDNWLRHDRYWNVPLDVLMANLDHALKQGFTAAIDIDVSERKSREAWTLPAKLERDGAVTENVRQRMFDSRATTDDHLMHIVGTATDENGKPFYLTKNSYGADYARDGHVLISRNYLMAKMLSFMVHEDGLAAETRARFSAPGSPR